MDLFDQVGRYGTVSLLKRNDPQSVVTSFGVDREELTFGRESSCGVRLYYPDVAVVHCKLVINDQKAFLAVLGESGVIVDGCKVYPSTSGISDEAPCTMVPLSNNSEFEIHGKRFRFAYPPKEMRATLMATPPRPHGRALRLSMIQSAQVFSPAPSNDPRVNLRILQTPLKNTFKSPSKPSFNPSPLKSRIAASSDDEDDEDEDQDGDEEEEEIVLVETNHPRVVEEEQDLVIMEDVPETVGPQVGPRVLFEAPRTPPRRRSMASNALHRAVLIRSAQRAVLRAEKEREEVEEELEVMDAVVDEDVGEEEPFGDDNPEPKDVEMGSPSESEESSDGEEGQSEPQHQPAWRKSLGKIWPFSKALSESPTKTAKPKEALEQEEESDSDEGDHEDQDEEEVQREEEEEEVEEQEQEQEEVEEREQEEDEEEDMPGPLPARTEPGPVRRPLGAFMTPQRGIPSKAASNDADMAGELEARHSLGGGGPQRLFLQPWKIKELVVPEPPQLPQPQASPGRKPLGYHAPSTPGRGLSAGPSTPSRGTPAISEEERKAIRERRRSALREPDTFFAGGIPGMGPPSPSKPSIFASGPASDSSVLRSPVKPLNFNTPKPAFDAILDDEDDQKENEEPEQDSEMLMRAMKDTVEMFKRRQSFLPPPDDSSASTEVKEEAVTLSGLAQGSAAGEEVSMTLEGDDGLVDKRSAESDEMDVDVKQPGPFSLIRAGEALELPTRRTRASLAGGEAASSSLDTISTESRVLVSPNDVPPEEDEDEIEEKPKKRGNPKVGKSKTEEKAAPSTRGSSATRAGSSRQTRRATAEPPETVQESLPEAEEEDGAPAPVQARRGRKPASTSSPAEAEAAPTKRAAPTKPRSRSQNAKKVGGTSQKEVSTKPEGAGEVDDSESAEEAEANVAAPPASAKRGRPRKAATTEETPAVAAKPPSRTTVRKASAIPTAATRTRATKTAAAPAPIAEAEEEGDELDSYRPNDSVGKAPATATRGRKKVVPKEEEEETKLAPPTRAGRSAATTSKLPAPTATRSRAAAATPAPATTTRKLKTPASAPAAPAPSRTDKENTPDLQTGTSTPESSEEVAPPTKVPVRVSKTRTGATTAAAKASGTRSKAVKVETEEAAPARATRTTRTRTKTG